MKTPLSVLSESGQYVLGFFPAHEAALKTERERLRIFRAEQAAARRRERRGTLRHLMDLMSLPSTYMTADELAKCDAYIEAAKTSVQANWTMEREAEARGVDIRKCARLVEYDGRLFQDDYTVPSVSAGDIWVDGDYED